MAEDNILVTVHYGTVEIVPAYKFEGDWLYCGGFSIRRDRRGKEISRTEPTYTSRLRFECATTEPKKTLWQKITERL